MESGLLGERGEGRGERATPPYPDLGWMGGALSPHSLSLHSPKWVGPSVPQSLSPHSPSTYEKINGATIVASELIMNFGVSTPSLYHVIFSFGTAPE